MDHPLFLLKKKAVTLAAETDFNVIETALFAALQAGDDEWTAFCLGRLRSAYPESLRVEKDAALVKEGSENAANAYRQILVKTPEEAWVRKRLGCLLKRQGRIDEGAKFLAEQSTYFSSDSELFHEQAMIQLTHFGSITKSLYMFEEVLLCNPVCMYNLVTYGELLCSNGDWDAGRKYFCFALRLKPDDVRALWLLAVSLTKCKKQGILNDLTSATKEKVLARYAMINDSRVAEVAALVF